MVGRVLPDDTNSRNTIPVGWHVRPRVHPFFGAKWSYCLPAVLKTTTRAVLEAGLNSSPFGGSLRADKRLLTVHHLR